MSCVGKHYIKFFFRTGGVIKVQMYTVRREIVSVSLMYFALSYAVKNNQIWKPQKNKNVVLKFAFSYDCISIMPLNIDKTKTQPINM